MVDQAQYSPTPADIHDQLERLTILRRRLSQLQRQQAQYGTSAVPAHIPLEIDDLRAEIGKIKQTLRRWQVPAPDHPDDLTTTVSTQPETNELLAQSALTPPELHNVRDIRALRIAPYSELWKLLKPLAKYDLPQPLTVAVLEELSIALRDWYFDVGGLFLSEQSRGPYFELKETIRIISDRVRQQGSLPLSNAEIARVLAVASELRAQLAKDLGTR
jgi:hypothetical protein